MPYYLATASVVKWPERKDGLEVFTSMAMKGVVASCSPVEVHRQLEGTYRLHLEGGRVSEVRNQKKGATRLLSSSAYCVSFKMETICCSETSVDFYQTTRCYNSEDYALQDTFTER
jgi:hypothetical protein